MSYLYAWGIGFDLALGALTNVADDLYPYTRPIRIAPTSQPIDRFPIRDTTLDGVERGSGMIGHVWSLALPLLAFSNVIVPKFTVSGEKVTEREMTIYTYDHEYTLLKATPVYSRWNARVYRPQPRRDYTTRNRFILDLALRMLLVEELV